MAVTAPGKPKGKKGATATASKSTAKKGTEESVNPDTAPIAVVAAPADDASTKVVAVAEPVAETKSSVEATILEPEEDDEEGDEDEEEGDDEEDDDESEGAAKEGEVQAGTDEDDGVLRIPENEWNFLQEILKCPIGNNQYEISKEAPKAAFKGRGSPKTLAQTAKKKLEQRKIIELVQPGGAQRRAIVRLLIDSVEMSREGRGRKISPSKQTRSTASATGRRPGRPKGSVNRTERAPQINDETASTPGRRPGRTSYLQSILADLRDPNYEDPNEFAAELEKMTKKFPNTFNKLLKRLQQPRNTGTGTGAAA